MNKSNKCVLVLVARRHLKGLLSGYCQIQLQGGGLGGVCPETSSGLGGGEGAVGTAIAHQSEAYSSQWG